MGMGQMMTFLANGAAPAADAGPTGPITMALVVTEARPYVPAGYVPLNPEDKDWFMRWFALFNPTAKGSHAKKDPSFNYADPAMLARFLNAKTQVTRLVEGRIPPWDLGVGSGGVPLSGDALRRATNYHGQLIAYWNKCDRSGASAWASGPLTMGTLKVPKRLVDEFPNNLRGLAALVSAQKARCPGLTRRRALFGLVSDRDKVTAEKLLYNYSQEKQAVLERSALTEREKSEARAAEIAAAEARAEEARAEAAALETSMSDLESRLAEATAALEAARAAPAPAAPGMPAAPSPDVAAMQAMVATLTAQLAETRTQMEESQREAELAEEAAAIESGFLARYKWHLIIGGGALVAAGAWYYFKKYKPAQAAAAGGIAANPEDEDPVFLDEQLVGYVAPSAIEGRYVARSLLLDRPTYSALNRRRAENWLRDVARRVG
jgi:hypothetical protein